MVGRNRAEQRTRRHSTFSVKPIMISQMKKHSISMPNVAHDNLFQIGKFSHEDDETASSGIGSDSGSSVFSKDTLSSGLKSVSSSRDDHFISDHSLAAEQEASKFERLKERLHQGSLKR